MTSPVLAGPLDWLWALLGRSRSPRLCEWCLEQLHGEPVLHGASYVRKYIEDSRPGRRRQFFHIGCHMRWQHCCGVRPPQTLTNKMLRPPGPRIEKVPE